MLQKGIIHYKNMESDLDLRFNETKRSNELENIDIGEAKFPNTSNKLNLDNSNQNSFENDIVLPNPTVKHISERRESKDTKSKREMEEEEREKMQVLVSNFTEDQLDRYEMYRRAAFPKAAIKRIMQTITGCSVSPNVVIAMSGIAKVFIGEIVEEALDVMETQNETGPVQPKHLREAVRRLRLQGKIPNGKAHKTFFRL